MLDTTRSPRKRLAYLLSNHPIISQSFVLREVVGLRKIGVEVDVISIGRPDRPLERMSSLEREEVARTFYLKNAGPGTFLKAHLSILASRPGGYCRAFREALRVGGFNLLELLRHLVYFLQAGLIFYELNRRGVDHFHTQFLSPAGLFASYFGSITMSMRVHGSDEFYDASRYRVAEKVRGSLFACAISTFTRSQLMRLTPPSDWDKFEVVRVGVDPLEFQPRPFRESPRPFEILCVARLNPAKGLRILLQALAGLLPSRPDVRLTVVGDGPDRESLEEWTDRLALRGHIRFEGAINQDEIRKYYAEADLFVLPSFAEGIPVVLMEAMAMTVPCISTRTGAIPELIREGVDGLLVAPSDIEELADAIGRMMSDSELRRRLGEAGRRRIIETYDLNQNIPKLAGVFERRLWAHAPGD